MGKLVAIQTYDQFELMYNQSLISERSLNFILDTGLLYTHGLFFNISSFGTETNGYVPIKIAGTTKNVSLAGHTHSNYHAIGNDIDIGEDKIVSGLSDIILYVNDTIKIGNDSNPTYFYGTLTTIKNNVEYPILDTNNFSIESKTISGTVLLNVTTFKYGSTSYLLDYVKRLNVINTLDNLANHTSMGTTNENSIPYGFITMYTDGTVLNPQYALIRINMTTGAIESRSSLSTLWKSYLSGTFRNMSINGTNYVIATTSNSLPTIVAPSLLGLPGLFLSTSDDGLSLSWRSASDTWIAFVGATANTDGTAGYIPAPLAGDQEKFFRGDGTWLTVSVASNDLYIGSANSSQNSAQSNGDVYLVFKKGSNYLNFNIIGTGRTLVTSGANGALTINTNGYSVFTAATNEDNGTSGLVPAPLAGQLGSSKYYLKADGTWDVPVTSQYYLTLNGEVKGTSGSTNLGTIYAPSASGTGFLKCLVVDDQITWSYDGATYATSSHNHDSTYVKLVGSTYAAPITGPLWVNNSNGLMLHSDSADLRIWSIEGNNDTSDDTYGFHLLYKGSETGDDKSLNLYAHNQDGTKLLAYTVTLSGVFTFGKDVHAPNYYTTSDINKKYNILNISEHIRKFTFKDTGIDAYGVIALEVPEIFVDGKEGNMTVNYNSILSYYIGLLENRVQYLENRIKILERLI